MNTKIIILIIIHIPLQIQANLFFFSYNQIGIYPKQAEARNCSEIHRCLNPWELSINSENDKHIPYREQNPYWSTLYLLIWRLKTASRLLIFRKAFNRKFRSTAFDRKHIPSCRTRHTQCSSTHHSSLSGGFPLVAYSKTQSRPNRSWRHWHMVFG